MRKRGSFMLNLKHLLISIGIIVFSLTHLAQAMPYEEEEMLEAQSIMEGALKSFVGLIPYMQSKESFVLDEDRQIVEKHLLQIKDIFSKTEHIKALQSPSFLPSAESLEEHIDETISAVREKNDSFALMRMNAIAPLCISCHAQIPGDYGQSFLSSLGDINRSQFQSDFDYAEFLFLRRNYLKSVRYYERVIVTHLDLLSKPQQERPLQFRPSQAEREIRNSLNRTLTTFLKVNFMPGIARSSLEKFRNRRGLPPLIKRDIDQWILDLKKWENRDLSIRLDSVSQVRSFIDEYLEPMLSEDRLFSKGSHEIPLLIGSGILSKFLARQTGDPLEARALYWMARSSRQLDRSFFYSLSDLYLRDCVMKYPATEYAHQCLKEYKESITLGYTGSAGTSIPDEEKKKIEYLESFIKKAQKSD